MSVGRIIYLVKIILRIVAVAVILVTVVYWAAAGANRGWTKTSVPVKTLDDVTGIEGVTYHQKFVPGLDFLAVAVGLGILVAGASFLFRTKDHPQASNEQKNH